MNWCALDWKLEKQSQIWREENQTLKKENDKLLTRLEIRRGKEKKNSCRSDGRTQVLKKENDELRTRLETLEQKADDLEGRWKGTTSSFIEYKNMSMKHDKNVKSLCVKR